MSDNLGATLPGKENTKGTNVQVAVRCRPVNAEEKRTGQASVITCDQEGKAIRVSYGPVGKKLQKNYMFDKVFGMYSRQHEVFDSVVRPIVDEVLDGFNCTIFAYGQTGTGKTHTMEGNINSEDDAGIVPRSVKTILENLESSGAEFTIRVSFLELYNEELQDLLVPSGDKKLKLCEDAKKGVVCQNLEEVTVLNASDIFDILAKGIQQRQTAATLCNKNSSRSHSIFTMKIMIKECNVEGEEVVRHGQLNLVDLAGSECVGRSGAKNDRAREAGSINQSLLTLGRVITALVDHHGHIPYRDSKLTRLLQESLGGKAKTCIIATLSPSAGAIEETMSTLDYAHRAKSIKNQPVVNQRMTKKVIMKEYLAEVEMLRTQLIATREKNGIYLEPQAFYDMEAKLAAQESQLAECESALTLREEEVKAAKAERDELVADIERVTAERDLTIVELDHTKQSLACAQGEVTGAFVELKATEAVSEEQKQTEDALLTHGTALQKDLGACQDNVKKLLEKVDLLSDSEAQKVTDTQQFVQQLSANATALATQVQSMSQQSQEQRLQLGNGVSQILLQGRNTCSTLQTAIDAALSVMVGDAEIARDSMLTSCDNLKEHLSSTNTHLEKILRSIQGQLSDWLREVAVTLQQSQDQLVQQQTQIEHATAAVVQHCTQMGYMGGEFVSAQQQLHDEAAARLQQLQSDVSQQLGNFEQLLKSESTSAAQKLQEKASSIEQAVQSMLKQMVEEGTTAFTSMATESSTMCTTTSEKVVSGAASASSSFSSILNHSKQQAQQLRELCDTTSGTHSHQVRLIEDQRLAAEKSIDQVTSNVGQKRKFLDDTVTGLVGHVEEAVQEGVRVVGETADTARTVLTNVSSASQKMNGTVNESMTGFTSYMNKEGEELSTAMDSHFAVIGTNLQAQSAGLTAIEERGTSHGQHITSSILSQRGDTPTKLAASAALEQPLKRSRTAQLVAAEAKKSLNAGVGVCYDHASRQLQAEYFKSPVAAVHDQVEATTDSTSVKMSSTTGSQDAGEEVEGVNSGTASVVEGVLSKDSSQSTLPSVDDACCDENESPSVNATPSTTVISAAVSKSAVASTSKKSNGASASRLPRTNSKAKMSASSTANAVSRKTRSSVLTETL